jgi:hypothetical protein
MGRRSARISLVIAVLAAGALLACSSPERELRKAKAAGTVEALDAFLAQHPEGPLAEQAKDAKEQLFFDRAKSVGTVAAYEDFMKKHPQGKLIAAAQSAIEELHFKEAEAAGTIEAYEAFLAKHSQGPLARRVGQALDRLLPSAAVVGYAEVVSTDPNRCTVVSSVMIIHKSGALPPGNPPEVTPGMMNCAGTVGASGIEVEKVTARDPNHTIMQVRTHSEAGWAECRIGGTCTVRFSVLGQERVVTATW